jgi:hypothetical protein
MRSMFRKGDSSAKNWLLELGPDRRSHWGRHACAFWRVPGLLTMAYGMADLPASTPHACSTLWPRAGQSIDAGRCLASRSEKKGRGGTPAAQNRRATLADVPPTYGLPAGIDDPAVSLVAGPRNGHISGRWRGRDGRVRPDLGQP